MFKKCDNLGEMIYVSDKSGQWHYFRIGIFKTSRDGEGTF